LRRNAYGGRSPDDAEVERLETYIRDYAARLATMPRLELTK
jgi:hypothetical protein